LIVLDTHAFLWLMIQPSRLSKKAVRAIASADSIGVSAISAWEIALLKERGRIEMADSSARWITAAIASDERILEIPLDATIAVRAAELGARGFHGDPADRFIFATAEFYRADLVTRDQAIADFDASRVVW
jgi:PIN domain nuclease of toxin-antitoxin system